MTETVKLGTARSRIRIGEESNGFPESHPFKFGSAKTTPCTVGTALKRRAFLTLPWRGRVVTPGAQRKASRGGVISARAPFVGRDHPTPLALRAIDPPPPGEGKQGHCVLATLGGWAEVMKLVASSIAGPSGVGTFSQNGTRMRVPAIGAKATSMLRWAARYLITGRSGM